MPLEVATYLYDLVPTNPPGTDGVSQGDDHLRLIKGVLQNTFPYITGPGLPTSGGVPAAMTVSYPYAPPTYAVGQIISFMAGIPSLGPATISVNNGPAAPILYNGKTLVPEDIMPGNVYMLMYFSGAFNLMASSTGFGGGGVTTFNTRLGDVVFEVSDLTGVGGALLASPAFTGTPTAPTPPQTSNDNTLATTQYVTGMINTSRATSVISFNGRYQVVTLTLADITGAGGAPINSPAFTGGATVPTPINGDSSTLIANTAFVTREFAPLASPVLTGVPTVPVPALSDNSAQIANTFWVRELFGTYAPINSPAFTGTPTTPTPPASDNSQQIPNTLWVANYTALALGGYLPITGGTLTGTLTTAGLVVGSTSTFNASATFNNPVTISGTGNSSLLTMNKVSNSLANIIYGNRQNLQRWALFIGNSDPESNNNLGTNFQLTRYADFGAVIDNPLTISRATGVVAFSQIPTAPNPPPGDNSTNLATTAYVDAAVSGGPGGAFLPITGGTLTGSLTVSPTGTGAPGLILNSSVVGNNRYIMSETSGSARWQVVMGNASAETGGNVGSDFVINRFSDAGAYVDTALSINRATGQVVAADSIQILNAAGAFLYLAGGAGQIWNVDCGGGGNFNIQNSVSGVYTSRMNINYSSGLVTCYNGLSVSAGNLTVAAVISDTYGDSGIQLSGTSARYYSIANGVRAYGFGAVSDGAFHITDWSAVADRVILDPAGYLTQYGSMTVGGNLQVNAQINGSGNIIAAGVAQGHGDAGVQCLAPGGNARYYSYGGWVYYFGCISDGTFQFYNASTGQVPVNINPNGTWYCNIALYVAGGSTLVGTVGCNAINCGQINTQGNIIYAGYMDLSNGVGIGFAQQGGGSRKSFTSTGTQLTHYINGGAAGSWNFNAPSDERFKKNIGPMKGDPLAELRAVKLISFEEDFFRQEGWQIQQIDCGFSGQQLLEVLPEAVSKAEYFHGETDTRKNPIDDGVMLNVDSIALLARCVGAIQQLATRLEALEKAA